MKGKHAKVFTWKKQTSVKKLETSGSCFLCLTVLKFKYEDEHEVNNKKPIVSQFRNDCVSASLRCLRRYLRINLEELKFKQNSEQFTGNDGNNQQSLEEGREEEIEVDLCESCDKLVRRFSNKFQQLEVLQMEVNFCLEGIHQRISEATQNNPELVETVLRKGKYDAGEGQDQVLTEECRFANNLRKEIVKRSRRIYSKALPFSNSTLLTVPLNSFTPAPNKRSFPRESSGGGGDDAVNKIVQRTKTLNNSNGNYFKTEVSSSGASFSSTTDSLIIVKEEPMTIDDDNDDAQMGEVDCGEEDDRVRDPPPSPAVSSKDWKPPFTPTKSSATKKKRFANKNKVKESSAESSNQRIKRKRKPRPQSLTTPYIINRATGTYDCKTCSNSFKCCKSASHHYRRDHLQERHLCHKCGDSFIGKKQSFIHIEKCNGNGIRKRKENSKLKKRKKEKTVTCSVCKLQSPSDTEGIRHYREEHRLKFNFPCLLCENVILPTILEWKAHRKEVHKNEGYYTCEICMKKFSLIQHLKRHKAQVHDKKRFQCEICNVAEFYHMSYLRDHQKFCTKDTLEQRLIEKAEMETRRRESIHKCETCGKKFMAQNNLYKHVQSVHLKVKRFPCDECEKRFPNGAQLKEHKNSVHSGTLFYCKFCLKPSQSPARTRQHQRICGMEIVLKEKKAAAKAEAHAAVAAQQENSNII